MASTICHSRSDDVIMIPSNQKNHFWCSLYTLIGFIFLVPGPALSFHAQVRLGNAARPIYTNDAAVQAVNQRLSVSPKHSWQPKVKELNAKEPHSQESSCPAPDAAMTSCLHILIMC